MGQRRGDGKTQTGFTPPAPSLRRRSRLLWLSLFTPSSAHSFCMFFRKLKLQNQMRNKREQNKRSRGWALGRVEPHIKHSPRRILIVHRNMPGALSIPQRFGCRTENRLCSADEERNVLYLTLELCTLNIASGYTLVHWMIKKRNHNASHNSGC